MTRTRLDPGKVQKILDPEVVGKRIVSMQVAASKIPGEGLTVILEVEGEILVIFEGLRGFESRNKGKWVFDPSRPGRPKKGEPVTPVKS